MKTKAIKDLYSLPDDKLFDQLSEGLEHILNNASRIDGDAAFLGKNERARGSQILRVIAEEEAAKFLILIDAVRCPRKPDQQAFPRTLSYFDKHLAKGIYAKNCGMRPATFGRIRTRVEAEMKEYYLDGPSGFDWIFRNEILQKREEFIYVDYMESDGEYFWLSPLRYEEDGIFSAYTPLALKLARAFSLAGCTEPEALGLIAEIWRPVVMTDHFTWIRLRELNHQTLKQMEARGLLREQSETVCQTIIDEWLFPLHSLDLSRPTKVSQSELQEIQENWWPDI